MKPEHRTERRNLVLLSFAFIVYHAAEGSIDRAAVNVPGISAELGNPHALGVIAWVALLWFIVRFYQETGRYVVSEFRAEVNSWVTPPWLRKRIIEYAKSGKHFISTKEGAQIRAVNFRHHNGSWGASFTVYERPPEQGGTGSATGCSLPRYLVRRALAFYFVAITISGVAVSRYITPYYLSLIAITGPLWSQVIYGGT